VVQESLEKKVHEVKDSMTEVQLQQFIEAGSKKPLKKEMPADCEKCKGASLKARLATYPVTLTKPRRVAGKRVDVYRVALHECLICGHLMPTPAGQAKIERCVKRGIELFLESAR
jgi:hypothetical protein